MNCDENKTGKLYRNGKIVISIVFLGSIIIIIAKLFLEHASLEAFEGMAIYLTIMYVFPVVFLFWGWYNTVKYPDVLRNSQESCTQPVEAVISSFDKVDEPHGETDWTVYYAIYDYKWNNRKYTTRSNVKFVGMGKEGDSCTIFIDLDFPEMLYEINNEKKRILKRRILGIMMIVGVVFFFQIIVAAF